jgi:hypothetical protein
MMILKDREENQNSAACSVKALRTVASQQKETPEEPNIAVVADEKFSFH